MLLRPPTRALRRRVTVVLAAGILAMPTQACSQDGSPAPEADSSSQSAVAQSSAAPGGGTSATPSAAGGARLATRTRVLAISVDGLTASSVRRLGRSGAPALNRLLRTGASTLNARSSVEQTITLPNHTSMLTGRRIDRRRGGHGVTWNTDRRGTTVHRAAGERVASVFSTVAAAGGSSALFTGKSKFSLFRRSWPQAIDRYVETSDDAALVRAARRDLLQRNRAFTFVHLATPDVAGHAAGFGSPRYLRAVRRADRLVGRLVTTIRRHDRLRRNMVVVLTADHGGAGAGHSTRTRLINYRVPFLVWGAGVADRDLYRLNPQRRDPGTGRPAYGTRRQPVRNGEVANLATDLLGLGAVPGSQLNRRQDLRVLR